VRGNLASAQKEIVRALEIAPHCAVALSVQGALDIKMGHLETAAKSFQEAIDNDPTIGGAYLGLAMILISERRFKEALAPLDRAAGLLPASWYVHFQTGLAQLGVGDVEAAFKEADLAERLIGTDSEQGAGVSYLHAMVLAKRGDVAGTRKYLADVIARSPQGYYAEHAKGWLERLQVDLVRIPSGSGIGFPSTAERPGAALWPISTHISNVDSCIDVPMNGAALRCTGADCLIAPMMAW
jgi:tetratricopeptide (TPR) repeat protein